METQHEEHWTETDDGIELTTTVATVVICFLAFLFGGAVAAGIAAMGGW